MKIIVPFLGIKGGSGKSTSSQTFAYGVAKLGHFSFLMTTDPRRRESRELVDNRGFVSLDGRTEDGLIEQMAAFKSFDEGNELAVLTIDGGANEDRELDSTLSEIGDITIIPFMRSPDDMDSALIELTKHANAYGLPNRWPTNPMAREKANRYMHMHLSDYMDRMLKPNFDCNATIDFMGDSAVVNGTVNSVSKMLAVQILERVGINAFHKEFPNAD